MNRHGTWLILSLQLVISADAAAATFTLTPTVIGRLDENFSLLPFDAAGPITQAGLYQIDFSYTIADLAPDEVGFANTLFDIALAGNLQSGAGWQPFNDSINLGGSVSGGSVPTYFVNTDAGPNYADLQHIIASVAPGLSASDPRSNLGQNGAARLGSLFLNWDGVTYSSLSTRNITFSVATNQGRFAEASTTAAGAVIEFGIPGPGDLPPLPKPARPIIPQPPLMTPPVLPPPVVGPVLPAPPTNPAPPPIISPQPAPPMYSSVATFMLTPKVVARFDDLINQLPIDVRAGGPIIAGPGYYQIDFSFTVDGLAPTERGFANTLFDVALTGGLRDQTGAGWTAHMDDGIDTDEGDSNTPLYFVNTDAGADALDLQRIVASIAPHLDPSDPRSSLGQESDALLGSLLLHWDGETYSSLSTKNITFSIVDEAGNFQEVGGTAAGAVLEFGVPGPGVERVLPEPATRPPVQPEPPPLQPIEEPPIEVPPPPGPLPPIVIGPGPDDPSPDDPGDSCDPPVGGDPDPYLGGLIHVFPHGSGHWTIEHPWIVNDLPWIGTAVPVSPYVTSGRVAIDGSIVAVDGWAVVNAVEAGAYTNNGSGITVAVAGADAEMSWREFRHLLITSRRLAFRSWADTLGDSLKGRAFFGDAAIAAAALTSAPEPSSLVLATLLLVTFACCGRRRFD